MYIVGQAPKAPPQPPAPNRLKTKKIDFLKVFSYNH